MAFSPEDLQQLAGFVRQEVASGVDALKAQMNKAKTPEQAAAERAAVVGIPDVAPDAGPLYWVHLANGDVIESHDSSSTHMDVNGVTVPVTGRWEMPENAREKEGQPE